MESVVGVNTALENLVCDLGKTSDLESASWLDFDLLYVYAVGAILVMKLEFVYREPWLG